MIYKLKFEKRALKEWDKLGHTLKQQLKNKLSERLDNPHIPSARLSGKTNRYKIKLRASGYRLVYEVNDSDVVLLVIAIGKRAGDDIYHSADQR
ncbi:type II toxin-antitoxin system RelE/ParE family toxin [Candidatus Fukatsuia symbiotica]|uniref:Type II toxin-antitoxin system mRNA interferase toxin, RelE/StbE family n=1 Tax=Candidatus Fukatsuia symbiotica TaxID=1878942 RepID=A0A2U8I2Z1_9GAMM|nr:type II toxin-antitoxin system RelE/ParE family toxin [Candidatus Fukatsuia symbiotica]AWK13486.1 type II toxin-antitoxin system mRNA interferase toxin, RelE/StbE family [Candidatus Fukatsuia symbiotica]MEA9444393.1 type II toxin-antitoxin system RelE/ParE family toxin [Candidatus Fukatsuia symbiotica]